MNGKIALRDIIKAIVILKPGATMAVIQRMIWTKTPIATIGTALHCMAAQGLFTTRRVEDKGRRGFKCNAYYPTKKLLASFTVTREMREYLGLDDIELNHGKPKRKDNTIFEYCSKARQLSAYFGFMGVVSCQPSETRPIPGLFFYHAERL